MSLIRSVHHVQFACQNLWNMYRTFANGFGFKLHSCFFNHADRYNVAVENGNCKLLLNQTNGSPIHWGIQSAALDKQVASSYRHRELPFDIALEVCDVVDVCNRIRRLNGTDWVLQDPVVRSDDHGKVTMAVIKSAIGNVFHTVLDTSQYHGLLIPGFVSPERVPEVFQKLKEHTVPSECPPPTIKHLDHVALACNAGESDRIIHWYEEVFGMKRVAANSLSSDFSLDDPTDGFLVQYGLTGMKLKATSYNEASSDACTFVFVEPLEGSAPNQVTRFLDANGGPGIQHLGFTVDNIFTAVESCKARGTDFITPPKSYYSVISSSPSFARCPISLEKLSQSGVLLDPDVSPGRPGSKDPGMLLQIFTPPLFEPDAFFVELIQRYNDASGFGAGNILALWKAVEDSITSGKRQQLELGRLPS